jgi:folate-binding protein YgfZ
MRVFELGETTLLDVAASEAASLRERFDQSIFSEDAQVEEVSGRFRVLGVYGPLASGALASTLMSDDAAAVADLDALPLYANRPLETAGGTVIVVRSDEVGIDGFDLFVPRAQAEALAASLRSWGTADVDVETTEVTRIEAGRPRFGVDMDGETIPLEAGIQDRAISLTKGCYVGQEIIIRVLHRGQGRVAKRLVGLTFDASGEVARKGDPVSSGDRLIGAVTSSARSPALGRPVAMAYVHRDFTSASTAVSVTTTSGPQPATVTSLPIVPAQLRSVL